MWPIEISHLKLVDVVMCAHWFLFVCNFREVSDMFIQE